MRSALPRPAPAAVPSALERERPSNGYSSRRSTTPMPCSISTANARPARPVAAGRAEQIRPFERPIALGQLLEMPFGDLLEERQRLVQIVSGDTGPATLPPRVEERLEHAVQQLSPLERGQAGLVLAFLFELEHLSGEILEGTFQVSLDPADRVDDAVARANGAVIPRVRLGRAGGPQREPLRSPAGATSVRTGCSDSPSWAKTRTMPSVSVRSTVRPD